MKRPRNMAQMKEQNKTPEQEINKMEKGNLSCAGFKTLVTRMFKELSEDFNIKKIQSEMKDTPIKIKNNLQEINSRVDEAENQISNLEYKEAKTTNQKRKKKKGPKKMRIV